MVSLDMVEIPVVSVPNAESVREHRMVASTVLSAEAEQFCRAYVASGDATQCYRECFPAVARSLCAGALRKRAYDAVHKPKAAARIRELRNALAEQTVISAKQQLVDLADMAAVDLTQLQRPVPTACAMCHKLYDADLAARRPLPDLAEALPPHPSCASLKAHTRIETLPVEEWPPAARRLLESAEVAGDGSLRLTFRDRDRIQDMVNKLLGGYVSRSENITAHVQVDPSKPNPWSGATMTPEQVLERLRRVRAPVTIEQQVTPTQDEPP